MNKNDNIIIRQASEIVSISNYIFPPFKCSNIPSARTVSLDFVFFSFRFLFIILFFFFSFSVDLRVLITPGYILNLLIAVYPLNLV